MTKAIIAFQKDDFIKEHPTLSQLIINEPGDHLFTITDEQLTVVVKDLPAPKKTLDGVRMLAGGLARELGKRQVKTAELYEEGLFVMFEQIEPAEVVTAFVEGWELGSYQFLKYREQDQAFKTNLTAFGDFKEAVQYGEIRAAATAFARDLKNETPEALNPTTFPELLIETFKDSTVGVKIHNKQALEAQEFNGILTVCKGSKHDPAFAELSYKGDQTKPLVALVGKGVTFDTGGISLKGMRNLSSMRMDMGGAAAVAGAIKLLADSKAKVNVVALIPIVENIPDNLSVLPGDVIRYKNGVNVQVANTDYEGRLILADGIIRATELDADYIFNISTLTGSIVNALGTKYAGAFGDEELIFKIKEVGAQAGDFIWPMPLVDEYEAMLASDYADFSNLPNTDVAGAIAGGLFLRYFIPENQKWLHIDMAGVMSSKEKGYYDSSATGYGVRLLADFTMNISNDS